MTRDLENHNDCMEVLINKSQDAFISAVETYNRFTLGYRAESFCNLFCNAWELLLKAKIIKEDGKESIYRKGKENIGGKKVTISLKECIKKIYPDEKNPVRKNLEELREVRNDATHLFIPEPELEKLHAGLFQAAVLNYVNELSAWFGVSIKDRCSPGMIVLVDEIPLFDPVKLKNRYGKEIEKRIMDEYERVCKEEQEVNDKRYRIPVGYKLVLTQNPTEADISFTFVDESTAKIHVADPNSMYPLQTKDVVSGVKEALAKEGLSPGDKFNRDDFLSIVYVEGLRENPHYYWELSSPRIPRYSLDTVDFVVEKIRQNGEEYLLNAKEIYRKKVRHLGSKTR